MFLIHKGLDNALRHMVCVLVFPSQGKELGLVILMGPF